MEDTRQVSQEGKRGGAGLLGKWALELSLK